MKDYIKINLATPAKILSWVQRPLPNGKLLGEVKSRLLVYKNGNPFYAGLFSEIIFGPTKDGRCLCKKNKSINKKYYWHSNNIKICKRCEIQITESKVRNYRLGYINLVIPVVHLLYSGSPCYMAYVNLKYFNKLFIIYNM